MSKTDREIEESSILFAQKNKKSVAKERTDKDKYKPETHPVSVFMAGSPGAGKTESSKILIKAISGPDTISY